MNNNIHMKAFVITVMALATMASAQAGNIKNATLPDTLTYKLADDAKIFLGENKAASLTGVQPGDHVGLTYTEENGAKLVHRLHDFGTASDKKFSEKELARPKSGSKEPPHAKGGGKGQSTSKTEVISKHEHGVVLSVDPVGGVLVLNVRPQTTHGDIPMFPHGKIKHTK